jgi:hypothetical protein
MIQIAGGIVLAVLFLALLPAIIQGVLWVAAIGFVLAVAIGAGWLLFAGAQSSEGLGIELIVAGVFLVLSALQLVLECQLSFGRRNA